MDDFKLIKGIGPAIERRLHEAGITTFVQLATLSPDDVATLVNGAGVSSSRIVKENWIGRAEELATATEGGEATGKGRRRKRSRGTSQRWHHRSKRRARTQPDDLQLELDDASFEEVRPSMARAGLARAGYARGSAFEYLERAPPRSPPSAPTTSSTSSPRSPSATRWPCWQPSTGGFAPACWHTGRRSSSRRRRSALPAAGHGGDLRLQHRRSRRWPEAQSDPLRLPLSRRPLSPLHEHEIDEGVGPSSRFSTTRMMFPSAAVYRFDLTVLSSSPMR